MSTRRDLLALTTAAVVARAVLPTASRAETPPFVATPLPGHPDAAVIAAVVAAVATWDEVEGMPPGQPDEVWEALGEKWHDAVEAVTNTRARTLVGCKAKARILLLDMEDQEPSELDSSGRLAWALARDILLGSMA